VLLLDEPTNDLDVETLQALEAAIEDFAGCAVIISHDRFFLDRLCTHILAFEGDAHVEWFEGNFEAYEEDKIRRLGPDSMEPKRVKYKKFTWPAGQAPARLSSLTSSSSATAVMATPTETSPGGALRCRASSHRITQLGTR
jgi:ABC-type sulfate/molybdate transport systems ATPase subunit